MRCMNDAETWNTLKKNCTIFQAPALTVSFSFKVKQEKKILAEKIEPYFVGGKPKLITLASHVIWNNKYRKSVVGLSYTFFSLLFFMHPMVLRMSPQRSPYARFLRSPVKCRRRLCCGDGAAQCFFCELYIRMYMECSVLTLTPNPSRTD